MSSDDQGASDVNEHRRKSASTDNLDPYATCDPTGLASSDPKSSVPDFIGRYRIERLLGSGSFGSVFLAHDDSLNRPVAVKVPHSHLVQRPEDAEAYLTEARTVAILDHPHIVQVFDVGMTAEIACYMVSKYIPGHDLAAWSKTNRPSASVAGELVLTLAEALHYAHRQGVVHRDIKPSNILIDHSGRPYVVDFGVALQEKNLGIGPLYIGTPAYMSPEQARGEGNRVDGRSDIFSLGVVFYELLSGRLPFYGKSTKELLEHIVSWDPKPPRQINDTIPKELERICLSAIAKRATDRYTTARDLSDDLRRFLENDLTMSPASPTDPIQAGSIAIQGQLALIQVPPANPVGAGHSFPEVLIPPSSISSTAISSQKWIGDFQIMEKLGQGGMGAVYRAWHPKLRRQVALKVLLSVGNEKHEQRFAREIRALGPVRDEHLAEVFSSGSENGLFYYAMELIEGTTLDAVCHQLQSNGSSPDKLELSIWQAAVSTVCDQARSTQAESGQSTMPDGLPRLSAPPQRTRAELPTGRSYVQHITELTRQVASAVHKLHEVGAIHRDIKPGNIMVGHTGTKAVLIDLGLAQLADESDGKVTRTRQFVGTLRYASPEQVLAVARMDCRCDIYSLGATLWELLTLRAMFSANDQTPTPDLMSRIQYEEPESVRKYNQGVSKDLDAIVLKCLEKDPKRRYATALEFAEDLQRFLSGLPVVARPVGAAQRVLRKLRRVSVGLRFAGVAIALMLLAFGLFQFDSLARQSQLNVFKQAFSRHMEQLRPEASSGRAVLTVLDNMRLKFRQEEVEKRVEFESRWKELIKTHIGELAQYQDADIERIRNCIALLNSSSHSYVELTSLLDKRLKRGNVLVDLRPPYKNISEVFEQGVVNDVEKEDLRLQGVGGAEYVRTSIPSTNETEIEVVFRASSWKSETLGIELDAQALSRHSGFYVSVKGRDVEPITKGERLRIMRGELVLREREVFLGDSPLRIRLARKGHQLNFQVNDLPTVNLVDIFPIGSAIPSVFAIDWPETVGVLSVKAVKYLAEEPSPLEEGDKLFAERKFSHAADIYDQQALATSNIAISQEVRYKQARCLAALNQDAMALAKLQELSLERGEHWPILATCELCSMYLLRKDYRGADEAILRMLEHTPDPRIFSTLFERIDSRIISDYSTNMSIPRQLLLDVNLVKPLCSLMLLLQESVEDLPIARQLSTTMRLGDACLRTGLEDHAEKLYRKALKNRQPYQSATVSPELDVSLAIFRDLVWLLIRNDRAGEAMLLIKDFESSTDLPNIFKTILAFESARVFAAQEKIAEANASLDKFFELADEYEDFNPAELADAYLMKGFLAADEESRSDIWMEGFRRCKRPQLMADIRMAMLGSLSRGMSDDDARMMITQVSSKLDAVVAPMLKAIEQQFFDAKDILAALKDMWASQRGIAYARRHVFRRASAMEVIAIQIPLCTYEICRKGAFAGDPSEEVDELIWSSFGELFSMYKRGEIELFGIMRLFYAWQGRFDYLAGGWNSIAPSLPSDSLRAKLAFLCGCHMKRQTNNEIATKFFRDALKNAVGNDDLNRIINAEAKELSK